MIVLVLFPWNIRQNNAVFDICNDCLKKWNVALYHVFLSVFTIRYESNAVEYIEPHIIHALLFYD